ncbi:hypothetical protein J6590_043496 [Homalodisca vitripennis]|nr:hypothetical protein J6590_043496 [Homalodisca vitripennis]
MDRWLTKGYSSILPSPLQAFALVLFLIQQILIMLTLSGRVGSGPKSTSASLLSCLQSSSPKYSGVLITEFVWEKNFQNTRIQPSITSSAIL